MVLTLTIIIIIIIIIIITVILLSHNFDLCRWNNYYHPSVFCLYLFCLTL
jgi:hypothetical protein